MWRDDLGRRQGIETVLSRPICEGDLLPTKEQHCDAAMRVDSPRVDDNGNDLNLGSPGNSRTEHQRIDDRIWRIADI